MIRRLVVLALLVGGAVLLEPLRAPTEGVIAPRSRVDVMLVVVLGRGELNLTACCGKPVVAAAERQLVTMWER